MVLAVRALFERLKLCLSNLQWRNGRLTVTATSEVEFFCRFRFRIPYFLYESDFIMSVACILTKLWTGKFFGCLGLSSDTQIKAEFRYLNELEAQLIVNSILSLYSEFRNYLRY